MNQSFFARRSFTIIAIVVFLMPFLWMGTRRALESNRNDVRDWLPGDFPETKTHRWFQERFPHEQFVLASWEGCTLDDPRLELLARKLETFDPNLERLGITGKLAKLLEANKLSTRRSIEEYGDLRSIEGISPEQATEVAKAAGGWVSPFKTPVLTGGRLVDQLQKRYENLTREELLKRLEGSLIGEDHHKTCLVVTLTDQAKGKNLRTTLEDIRELARQCDIEPEKEEAAGNFLVGAIENTAVAFKEMIFGRDAQHEGIYLGGPPVDNVAIDVEGECTLFRLAGLSAVVGLGISWLCFRSLRLTFLVFFVAVLAAGIGLASVFFSGGTVDAVLLSMPSLVYVLAISGAVHIVNYYHDSVREHGLERAPERALRLGMVPCALAAITTALGLGSLVASHLVPINKFGIYSAWGVLATLGLLFLYLPACLHYLPSREYLKGGARNPQRGGGYARMPYPATAGPETSALARFWHAVGGFVTGHNRLVTVGCLVVMAVFFVGLSRVETSVKLMKLFSPDAEIIHDYGWLEDHLGPLVPMEVVIRVDNQKCKLSFVERMRLAQHVERVVERLPDVGGVLSAATFAPNIAPDTRKKSVVEMIAGLDRRRQRDHILSKKLEEHRQEFREYLTVDKDIAVADEDSNPNLRQLGITNEISELLEAEKLGTLLSIEQFGNKNSVEENLETIRGIGPEKAAQVAQAIDAWRTAHGEELWRVSARVRALGDLDYGLFVNDIRDQVKPVLDAWRTAYPKKADGIDATYTGLVPLVYKAQHELMSGLYNSLKWAFILIALVMVIVLRSLRAGLLSMIPNIFPVVLIFGAMGWLGILVDVGTMMTASVALGVAVDDTVHFLTWFRRGLDQGRDRKGAVMLAYERCGTALSQTTLIGGLGLSVFAFSTFTPTQRFGVLMLTLLTAALIGDLIFLPALLSGPVGRFFRSPKKKSAEETPRDELAGEVSEDELVAVPIAGTPPARHIRRDIPHRSTKAS